VTRKGRPVAALTPIGSQTDLENLAVSNDPEFRALIERSRRLYPAGSGLTTAEVRRKLRGTRRPGRRSSR
jgi:antitoxin (DNA-binding transcriptional repressor) of toxin-antitoxin stability system